MGFVFVGLGRFEGGMLPGDTRLAAGMAEAFDALRGAHDPALRGGVELDGGGPRDGEPPQGGQVDGLGVEASACAVGREDDLV